MTDTERRPPMRPDAGRASMAYRDRALTIVVQDEPIPGTLRLEVHVAGHGSDLANWMLVRSLKPMPYAEALALGFTLGKDHVDEQLGPATDASIGRTG